MSTNLSNESSNFFAGGSSRAGDSRLEQDEAEAQVGRVAVEREQNGREVRFFSLAPQEDITQAARTPRQEKKAEGERNELECAVDPSSGQAVLGGPNSQAPSTPVSVVEDEGNATVCLYTVGM